MAVVDHNQSIISAIQKQPTRIILIDFIYWKANNRHLADRKKAKLLTTEEEEFVVENFAKVTSSYIFTAGKHSTSSNTKANNNHLCAWLAGSSALAPTEPGRDN